MSSFDEYEMEAKPMTVDKVEYTDYINKVVHGDCLEVMEKIKPNSVDMILTDLPYGYTSLKWDNVIDMGKLFDLFWIILKENGLIVTTSAEPFTSKLIMDNLKEFKYRLIWKKSHPSNHLNAKIMFMRWDEDIVVFYRKLPTFNPQMVDKEYRKDRPHKQKYSGETVYGKAKGHYIYNNNGKGYPSSILEYSNIIHGAIHPTQKPVKLFEYLAKTFSNEGDTILDCCAGLGTTGIACQNTGRDYILIEKERKYIDVMSDRGLSIHE